MMSISSHVSPQRSDLPAIFESLNDDSKRLILQFLGNKSYRSFGGLNKHCREVYLNTSGMTKETFVYGYGPLSVIKDRIERANPLYDWEVYERVGKGVVLFNRRDVLDWAHEEKKKHVLKGVCNMAAKEGRIDLLDEVWNNVNDEEDKEWIFRDVDRKATRGGKLNVMKWIETKAIHNVDYHAALHGKLNVMKWLETKGLPFNKKERYIYIAAKHGHLHILEWLREEQGFELDGYLYEYAIEYGGHLHVMKWLREQEVDWPLGDFTFTLAAQEGNLDILQWLHDEGCPWPEYLGVPETEVKSEVIKWLRVNGYGDRISINSD